MSNRLPVRVVQRPGGAVDVVPSSGGVATALREVQRERGALWLGWPGDVEDERQDEVTAALAALDIVPLFLSTTERERFYEGFASGVLWPLFHADLDRLPLDAEDAWLAYRAVNARFADAALAHGGGDGLLWVHDFQLALVPGEVRARTPGAAVGYFLHVPFPPADLFRVLPWHEEVLAGMLGADVVGVHTAGYAEHLKDAAARLLGARVDGDRVAYAGHVAEVAVAPISVDVERFERAAHEPGVQARVRALREDAHGRKIFLGVDRLDYTKGIPARLTAFERLLEEAPALADAVQFVQVAVPTREHVGAYAAFKKEIDELVGRINGKHGSAVGMPIHFLYREVPFEELVALYCAADVMVVTPLRDGMNLVCKEYCASRVDEQGVLVLSELAGAADELDAALLVNPFDIAAMARMMRLAAAMPEDEQRVRMAGMRRHLKSAGVARWAADFIDRLARAAASRADPLEDDLARAADAAGLSVVLDYDGTLVPIEATPSQAAPDDETRALLAALAACPGTQVHVVSGRAAGEIEAWLGELPLWLHAEHGAHVRPPGDGWRLAAIPPWLEEAGHALDVVAAQAPGSFVERKRSSVALHVRCVAKESRAGIARGAALVLAHVAARPAFAGDGDGLVVVTGDCVIEGRSAATHKDALVAALPAGDVVLAAGDDQSDDELFGALRGDAVTVAVGPRPRRARYRMREPAELRVLLARLAAARAARQARGAGPAAGDALTQD